MSTITDPFTGEVFEFVTRAECGLRAPRQRTLLASTSEGVFAHHTVTGTSPARSIWRGVQSYHMDSRRYSDVAYSFAYDVEGIIYEGRGWGISGGHTLGFNTRSHALVFIGNSDVDRVPAKAKRAFLCLYHVAVARYNEQELRGHRDVGQTGCPGSNVYAWVHVGAPDPGGFAPAPTPPEEDDMAGPADWTEADKAAFAVFFADSFEATMEQRGDKVYADLLHKRAVLPITGSDAELGDKVNNLGDVINLEFEIRAGQLWIVSRIFERLDVLAAGGDPLDPAALAALRTELLAELADLPEEVVAEFAKALAPVAPVDE